MSNKNLSITSYPVSCNIHLPIQCVSFSNVSRLAAIGCAAQLKILKIDNANVISEVCHFNNIPNNSTIMGASWSALEPSKLAVCFSNGSLCCLQVSEKTNKQVAFASEAWNSGKVASCVNKVSWHTAERNIVASANQDGQVKIFDFRSPHTAATVTTWGTKSSIAVRDVAFDPFHADVFAEVSDSGNLKLWDRRYLSSPVMSKVTAHSQAILTLDWHPTMSNMLATGSRDKNVKIWDFNACSIDNNAHDDSIVGSASSYVGYAMGSHHLTHSMSTAEGIEPILVSTLHSSSAIGRVMWRSGGENSYKNQIASVSVGATISTAANATMNNTSTSDTNGNISIWDLDHPNIPICILKGHEADGCADFQWIESLAGVDSTTLSGASGGALSTAAPANRAPKRGNTKSYGFDNYQKNMEAQQQRAQQSVTTLYILSANTNKEGKLLIQDLRPQSSSTASGTINNNRGVYFPYDHVSPSVVAISSQGDVAFHRGHIKQSVKSSSNGVMPGILTDKDKPTIVDPKKTTLYKTTPKGSQATLNATTATSPNASTKGPSVLNSGRVCFGRADIANLEESRDIRSERGAEGGVFDPALIYLLARNYSLAHTLYGCEEGDPKRLREGSYTFNSNNNITGLGHNGSNHHSDSTAVCSSSGSKTTGQRRVNSRSTFSIIKEVTTCEPISKTVNEAEQLIQKEFLVKKSRYEEAMEACRINLQVAKSAGLNCRASVWASLAALIPEPINPSLNTVVNATLPTSDAFDELMGLSFTGELPFALEMLSGLLYELMEGGDTQHFVVVCEILRKANILTEVCNAGSNPISEFRVRRTYLAYLDLLTKLQLFCEANEIIKASADNYISSLSKKGVEIHTRCAKCGKEITEKSATAWCVKCTRCVCMCALCNKPVSGLLHWCPVCGHGGHLECMKQWFQISNTCPSGCGHDCCSSLVSHNSQSHPMELSSPSRVAIHFE